MIWASGIRRERLLRTHGGAQLREDILREKPLELRLNIEAEKKKRMGLKATGLIEHGQKIFIGAGSSLYHFYRAY